MKNYLYVLLLLLVALVIGCSKENEPEEGDNGGGDSNKEWIMIDDIVMDSESQVFDIKFPNGYVVLATVDFQAQLFKGSRYLLNYYNTKRIVSVSGGGIYLYKDDAPATETGARWVSGESSLRYVPVSVLPQEPGSFDFYIEIDCNTESRPYAFRSRVYRLVLSRIEGGWNIDSFGLAPGQEE